MVSLAHLTEIADLLTSAATSNSTARGKWGARSSSLAEVRPQLSTPYAPGACQKLNMAVHDAAVPKLTADSCCSLGEPTILA